jgi:hypothetical protein
LLLLPLFSLSAQEPGFPGHIEANLGPDGAFLSPPLDLDTADDLGLVLSEAVDRFGLPQKMYPLRGEEAWQDDVVFFYPDYRYLYWFQDRVWQLRFDHRYEGAVGGARPGMNREELQDLLGIAHYQDDANLYYDLVDRGFPVRARFFFRDGILYDIYVYRSDF